jgi:hypothetical protein
MVAQSASGLEPPPDLASADCIEMDDIWHHALEVCNDEFVELHLEVILDEPFDVYSKHMLSS